MKDLKLAVKNVQIFKQNRKGGSRSPYPEEIRHEVCSLVKSYGLKTVSKTTKIETILIKKWMGPKDNKSKVKILPAIPLQEITGNFNQSHRTSNQMMKLNSPTGFSLEFDTLSEDVLAILKSCMGVNI